MYDRTRVHCRRATSRLRSLTDEALKLFLFSWSNGLEGERVTLFWGLLVLSSDHEKFTCECWLTLSGDWSRCACVSEDLKDDLVSTRNVRRMQSSLQKVQCLLLEMRLPKCRSVVKIQKTNFHKKMQASETSASLREIYGPSLNAYLTILRWKSILLFLSRLGNCSDRYSTWELGTK